ncbi:MAG: polyphosphate polymerase domain-containing protein, partial [Planctomycetes bacterium]|nr:polyphosphate polymerase domain-containing protein [Planctomycetota bacterium]
MTKFISSKTTSGKHHSPSGATAKCASVKSKKTLNDKVLSCRYELKYRISESCAHAVASFIKLYLHADKYARKSPAGDYPISSLYFDSDCLRLCRDTLEGQKNRFKLRIRTYSDVPETPCFFEVKRRINNVILKARARVTKSHVPIILSGRMPEGIYKEDRQVIRQFQLYKDSLSARPLMLVKYDRQAFEGDTATRVRVTFDRVPGRAHLLGGESPLWARQREPLAG